ncbi:MAG: hypothetical protein J7L47_09150 [Candidatus Odinarchaeota archaeon]|nr:hypothetical protein [Candidatus Odinarchaeota archaeon]
MRKKRLIEDDPNQQKLTEFFNIDPVKIKQPSKSPIIINNNKDHNGQSNSDLMNELKEIKLMLRNLLLIVNTHGLANSKGNGSNFSLQNSSIKSKNNSKQQGGNLSYGSLHADLINELKSVLKNRKID